MDSKENDKDIPHDASDDHAAAEQSAVTKELASIQEDMEDDGNDDDDDDDLTLSPHHNLKEQRKIKILIIILSVAFLLLVAGMQGLFALQSSLNAQIGIFGLCANFATVVFSCLFLSSFLVQRLGCKWAIVLGMTAMLLWMAANFYPVWGTILPASVIMGLGMAPLWTAQCTFFTVYGVRMAKLTKTAPDAVIARGFGFFFMAFMTGPIWGNLISSAILSHAMPSLDDVTNASMVAVAGNTSNAVEMRRLLSCGADFCPQFLQGMEGTAVAKPPWKWLAGLIGIYIGLGLLAVSLVLAFTPNIRAKEEHKEARFSLQLCVQTVKQLRNRLQLLMVPLNIYVGMEEGFMMVDFTRGFVTCALGVQMLGYVVISYAAMAAVVSFTSGHLIRLVGRPVIIIVGSLSHVGCAIFMLTWKPDADRVYIFFIITAFWGLGDAVLQSQINAFYGVAFSTNSEAAFSNYRMWESVGLIFMLCLSPYVCGYVKLYILLAVLVLGISGYMATEVLYRKISANEGPSKFDEGVTLKGADEEGDEAGLSEDDDDVGPLRRASTSVSLFAQYTDMIRRKSIIYVPDDTVYEAESLLLKSAATSASSHTLSSEAIDRRLNLIDPDHYHHRRRRTSDDINAGQQNVRPRRKISEGARGPVKRDTKPRRVTVHEMPDRSQLEVPQRLQQPGMDRIDSSNDFSLLVEGLDNADMG